jgi:hypothetical protein
MKRALTVLASGLLGFVVLEAALFHTPLYSYFLSPDSSTGQLELILSNELNRVKESSNQILAIGDSRMAVMPRIANQMTPQSGYTYASVGVAGATPRSWYYMLRHVDPQANGYRAIIVCLDSYEDDENVEDIADRETDLNYLVSRLGLSDIREFSQSFHTPELQQRAVRGILFKGLVYKRDLQDFLLHPIDRVRYVLQAHRDSHDWYYGFVPPVNTLTGLQVDWEHRTLTPPPGLDPDRVKGLQLTLLNPLPPEHGQRTAYLKYWLGKIYDHYRNSATQLVFVRVPRAPWIRPDLTSNPNSSVHQLAQQVNVKVLRPDLMAPLEKPEFFRDQFHLNATGVDQFTHIIELEMRSVLAPIVASNRHYDALQ